MILSPWKLAKSSPLHQFVREHIDKISRFVPLEIIQPSQTLNYKETVDFFAKEIKKTQIEKPVAIAFDENGKALSSEGFARLLEQQEIKSERIILFFLGGAYGLPKELKSLVRLNMISLSPMTMAHELALAVVLEQVFRSRCILIGHPYHHGDKSELASNIS